MIKNTPPSKINRTSSVKRESGQRISASVVGTTGNANAVPEDGLRKREIPMLLGVLELAVDEMRGAYNTLSDQLEPVTIQNKIPNILCGESAYNPETQVGNQLNSILKEIEHLTNRMETLKENLEL